MSNTNLAERVTQICVTYYTNFCVQSGAVEIFIILGQRAPSPGVCRSTPRDRAVDRRLNIRPPRGLETLGNKHPVTERHISEEWRSHTNFVTRTISLWWQGQAFLDTYWCGSVGHGDFRIERDRKEDKMHVIYVKKIVHYIAAHLKWGSSHVSQLVWG